MYVAGGATATFEEAVNFTACSIVVRKKTVVHIIPFARQPLYDMPVDMGVDPSWFRPAPRPCFRQELYLAVFGHV